MKNPFDNPVLSLDLRSRVRERRLWVLAAMLVAMPLLLSAMVLAIFTSSANNPLPYAGEVLAAVALFSHGALICLLSALGAAQRISQERERRTLPALVNSPLSPQRIADGKLLGAWAFAVWLSFTTLPFLAVSTLWGGIPAGTLLLCWLYNVAAAMATASLALGLSGLFGRSLSAYLATGAVLFLWCAVIPVVGLLTMGSATHVAGEEIAKEAIFCASFYHLPLAPQVVLFAHASGPEHLQTVCLAWAPAVWLLIALAGRSLAARGLRREIY